MGKLTGGIGGVLQGKIAGLNYKYVNGQNVVSQYVKNIRNPKTEAQLAQRFKMKSLAFLFSDVNSNIIRIAYKKKSLAGQGFQNIISQLQPVFQQLACSNVPAHNWFLHVWRILVDTVRGRDDDRLQKDYFVKLTNYMFDDFVINLELDNKLLNFLTIYKTCNDNKLRLFDNIFVMQHFKNDLPSYMPFGWIGTCAYSDDNNLSEEDIYWSGMHPHVNLGMGTGWVIIGLPIPIINVDILENLYKFDLRNYQTYSSNPTASLIRIINPSNIKHLPISKIKKSYGMDLVEHIYNNVPEERNIDFNWMLDNKKLTVNVITDPKRLLFKLHYDSTDEILKGTGIEKISAVFAVIQSDQSIKYDTIISKGLTDDIEYMLNTDYNSECVIYSVFGLSNDNAASSPLTLWGNLTAVGKPIQKFIGYYNLNPFKFTKIFNNFNFYFRTLIQAKDIKILGKNISMNFYYDYKQPPLTFITNNFGFLIASISDNYHIIKITCNDSALIPYEKNVDINLLKDTKNNLGTFILQTS